MARAELTGNLVARGRPEDRQRVVDLLAQALAAARRHGFPVEEEQLVGLLRRQGATAVWIDAVR